MKNKTALIGFFTILLMFLVLYSNTGSDDSKDTVTGAVVPIEQVITNSNEIVTAEAPVVEVQETKEEEQEQEVEVTKADKIIAIAKAHIGVPYKMAGTTNKGFDCSGLIMTSFKKQGVLLPRASYEMAKKGKEVTLKDIRKGDLVFFKTNTQRPNRVSHVGLVTSVVEGVINFIHSSTKRGVMINRIDEKYYKKAYYKARRIL